MIRARAVRITSHGGPEVLVVDDVELAPPSHDQILVRVAAAGLNRADLLQRKGLYPAPEGTRQDIPGLEYAGTVESIGSQVRRWSVGDRVMGIVSGGGMATHVVVHEREALPVPETIDLTSAAAIPEAFLTAFDALFCQAALQIGEDVLIHAVGSGVGTAALQLAKTTGARVFGTSRTAEKLNQCKSLGLDHSILVVDGSFAQGISANVILDLVGAAYIDENFRALSPGGRIVTIGLMGGVRGSVPLQILLQKRAKWLGSVLRSRPVEQKIMLARQFEAHAMPLFVQRRLVPVIDAVVPMENIRDAHASMAGNNTFGKVVLSW